jgi:hypothetical protein
VNIDIDIDTIKEYPFSVKEKNGAIDFRLVIACADEETYKRLSQIVTEEFETAVLSAKNIISFMENRRV